jgi:hypothetical protein
MLCQEFNRKCLTTVSSGKCPFWCNFKLNVKKLLAHSSSFRMEGSTGEYQTAAGDVEGAKADSGLIGELVKISRPRLGLSQQ